LTGSYVAAPEKAEGGGPAKRRKVAAEDDVGDAVAAAAAAAATADDDQGQQGNAADGRVVVADFDVIREKSAAYDAAREDVIKRCRDAQKLSKNAIYSLHRGTLDAAVTQLTKVCVCVCVCVCVSMCVYVCVCVCVCRKQFFERVSEHKSLVAT
jgi:hypothetical protein